MKSVVITKTSPDWGGGVLTQKMDNPTSMAPFAGTKCGENHANLQKKVENQDWHICQKQLPDVAYLIRLHSFNTDTKIKLVRLHW